MGLIRFISERKIYYTNIRDVILKTFNELGNYLENGKYFITLNPRLIIYKKNLSSLAFLENLRKQITPISNTQKRFLSILKLKIITMRFIDLFFKIGLFLILKANQHKSNDDSTGYYCSLFFPQSSQAGIKMFTFSKKKTLNFLNSKNQFEKIVDTINTVPNEINRPKVEINYDNYLIIEDLIDAVPFQKIPPNKLNAILKTYFNDVIAYIDSLSQDDFIDLNTRDLMKFFQENVFDNRLKNLFIKLNFELLFKELPKSLFINFKGDNYSNNMIFTHDSYFLVDFEYKQKISIINTLLSYQKDLFYRFDLKRPLNSYKNGNLDKFFIQLFRTRNLRFNPNLRSEYLFITLFEMHPYGIEKYYQNKNLVDTEKISLNNYILDFMERYFEL